MISKRIALSVALISAVLAFSAQNAQAESSQVFGSVDVKKDSTYVYAGGVTSLSGKNLSSEDSFLVRGSVGGGKYSYDTTAVAGGEVDGDILAGDLMVGYQRFVTPATRLTGYVGASIENQDLSPNDPNAEVEGSEGGVKAQVELQSSFAPNIPVQVVGSYSTGFDTYWTQASVGYDVGSVTVGPEIGFQGNEAYNEQRYGAAVSGIDLGGVAEAKVSLGHAKSNRDSDSMYGNVSVVKNF